MANPFKPGSTQYQDFETMKDLKWHCTKCELKSGQAKTWQVWRQERGIQLDTNEQGEFYKKIYCSHCNAVTIHRKLKSLEILPITKQRSGIPSSVAKRVKQLYNFEEAVFLRKLSERELEVDHKFPQIRWAQDEFDNSTLSDEELKNKFILLTRSNNLLKSRFCERCVKEGIRGSFPGIEFWFEGGHKWAGTSKTDENGCKGCFWNDPYAWRDAVLQILNKGK